MYYVHCTLIVQSGYTSFTMPKLLCSWNNTKLLHLPYSCSREHIVTHTMNLSLCWRILVFDIWEPMTLVSIQFYYSHMQPSFKKSRWKCYMYFQPSQLFNCRTITYIWIISIQWYRPGKKSLELIFLNITLKEALIKTNLMVPVDFHNIDCC